MTSVEDVLDGVVEELCHNGVVSLMDKIIDYKTNYDTGTGGVDNCFVFFGESIIVYCMGIRFNLSIPIKWDSNYPCEGGEVVLGKGLTEKLNESDFPNIVREFKKVISL